MSSITSFPPTFPQISSVPQDLYPMKIAEFERIVEGLDDPRVERVDGYLVKRTDINPPHMLETDRLRRQLDRIVPQDWFVREEKLIRIADFDELQPDNAVVRGDPESFDDHDPRPADVSLLVEVSGSSLDRDRGKEWLAYAKCGVSVYWIVNLVNRRVEVYTAPGPDGYASHQDFLTGEDVPVAIAGIDFGRIAVSEILPRQKP